MSLRNLLNLLNSNKVDYNKVIRNCYVKIYNRKPVNINFIIPVKNRVDFASPMYNSFLNAKNKINLNIAYSELDIAYTVVEISENGDHKDFCENNNINYIWYKTKDVLFNKSLAFNIGALYSIDSEALLLHDIDCLVQSDFFIKLIQNIKNKNAKAMQCFTGRRPLHLNGFLTKEVINNKINVDDFKIGTEGVSVPKNGKAPGGSIYIKKDLFLKIGGFEPEFFAANAPEDAFFWDKVDAISKMHICDEPDIEVFHMNHPPTHSSNPKIGPMLSIYKDFANCNLRDKCIYIRTKSAELNNYYKKIK